MRVLGGLLKLAIFLVLTGFALSNTDTATLRFFGIPEFEWRAPLVLLLLLFFASGAVLGALAAMPVMLRQRRAISRLQREASARAAAEAAAVETAARAVARREPGVRGI